MRKRIKKVLKTESLKAFRAVFLKSFILDVLFIALTFISLSAVRWKLSIYMALVQNYAQQLMEVQQAVQQNAANMAMMEPLMDAVAPISRKALILIYVIAPLSVWILWTLSQGINFSLVANKRVDWRYVLKFGLVSLPFFAAFTILLDKIIGTMNNLLMLGIGALDFLLLLLAFFIASYLMFIASSLINKGTLKELPKRALKVAVLKAHKVVFYYFLFSVAAFGIPAVMLAMYSNVAAGIYRPLTYLGLIMALVILAAGWFRTFLILRVETLKY